MSPSSTLKPRLTIRLSDCITQLPHAPAISNIAGVSISATIAKRENQTIKSGEHTHKSTISNWYSGSAYHVEQFKTSDGKMLLDTQVDALVSAMAAFAPPAAGQTTLPPAYQTSLNTVIAANWQ